MTNKEAFRRDIEDKLGDRGYVEDTENGYKISMPRQESISLNEAKETVRQIVPGLEIKDVSVDGNRSEVLVAPAKSINES